MTPSAFRYIAGLYEHAVDARLDVGQIRTFLADRGIRRSNFQVADDLGHVFCFPGYAGNHPAPAALTLAQIDKQFD